VWLPDEIKFVRTLFFFCVDVLSISFNRNLWVCSDNKPRTTWTLQVSWLIVRYSTFFVYSFVKVRCRAVAAVLMYEAQEVNGFVRVLCTMYPALTYNGEVALRLPVFFLLLLLDIIRRQTTNILWIVECLTGRNEIISASSQ
jgi:hypothetical protein